MITKDSTIQDNRGIPAGAAGKVSDRRRNQRGSALLEGAFITLPIISIMLALVDVSRAIFLDATFNGAVREGVRYAITSNTLAQHCHDSSIKEVVKQRAFGMLNGSDSLITVSYFDPNTGAATSVNAGGNIVRVTLANYQMEWLTPILKLTTPLTINVASSDVMEASPGGIPPARTGAACDTYLGGA